MNKLELQKKAVEVRKGIVTGVYNAKSGHPGGSLSAADLFTYLYFEEMNVDPKNPEDENRDRFVLSKGHTAPGYYAALALKGFFPIEDLKTLRHVGSYLQGHPDKKHTPGVDMSSGSLGQGLSVAVGMALAAKMQGKDYRTYCLCGDGEIQEGQIWEAAMFAGHRKLDNLCVIVDNNNLQIDGTVEDVCSPYPIDEKFKAFNFHVTISMAMTLTRSTGHLLRQSPTRVSLQRSSPTRSRARVYHSWRTRPAGMERLQMKKSIRSPWKNLRRRLQHYDRE